MAKRNNDSPARYGRSDRPIASAASGRRVALMAILTVAFCSAAVQAAQLRLRAECRCRGPVVTLGDVADVLDADAEQADRLAALELFPAPAPGTKRYLQAREVQDLLLIQGVNLLRHSISGANQVVLLGVEEEETAENDVSSASVMERAERRVAEAVARRLQSQVSGDVPWSVDVRLDPAQARLIASRQTEISVRGGSPPWVGAQRLEITARSPERSVRFHVDAQIALPASVVVAAKSLPRGAMIRPADVRLERGQLIEGASDAFHATDQVLGQQTTRAIPAGTILDRKCLRLPVLVRRGEMVAVYARSAGIQVRTAAKAREEGSLGDLIEVESLADRAVYFARVCGVQEVEVYARATRADRAAASDSDRTWR